MSLNDGTVESRAKQFLKYLTLRREIQVVLSELNVSDPLYESLQNFINIAADAESQITHKVVSFDQRQATINDYEILGTGKLCISDSYCFESHNLMIEFDKYGVQCVGFDGKNLTTSTKVVATMSSPETIESIIELPTGSRLEVCFIQTFLCFKLSMLERNSRLDIFLCFQSQILSARPFLYKTISSLSNDLTMYCP